MLSGAGRAASYTSFNMVSNVTEGTTNLSLLYDPEHARIQQTAPEGTTYYFNDPVSGAMTERYFPTTGSSQWKSYILADGRIVAERLLKGTSSVTMRYFVLDHLGSTVALTNETGALVETDAYDAWGKQRNATTGADDTTCSIPTNDFSTRGFTGQEEMPDLCLVNMNARIYDPVIGRFMSPDDVISDPYNGQDWNRYTYVDNNPLSYTDPTGHVEVGNNDGALANMSAAGGHINVYVDSDGEMHAMTGDEELNNAINHALNSEAGHSGLSGSHLGLAFSGGKFVGAFTFAGGDKNTGPADVRAGIAAFLNKHNDSASVKFEGGSYRYSGVTDDADKQAAVAWSGDQLSDGTKLNLHSSSNETGFVTSSTDTTAVSQKKVCVACYDGLHEGTQFDYDNIPAGSYPSHSHTRRQGDIPGPGDNSAVKTFGRGYVLTPVGGFAIEPEGTGYQIRQFIGDPLNERQIDDLGKFVNQWSKPGGAGCHVVFCHG